MPKRFTIKLKQAINEKDVAIKTHISLHINMSEHYESGRWTCKPCMLFTRGDFANIWRSGVITLHINTARFHYIIIPSWMSSSVLSPRIQVVWIIGGNIWDSIAQYYIRLLLQQHERMLKVCQLQGRQGDWMNLIPTNITAWRVERMQCKAGWCCA